MFWIPKKAQHKAKFDDTPEHRAYAARARAAMEGFLARDEARSRELVELLTPLLYNYLQKRYRKWLPLWAEIQSRCFCTLVEWRHAGRLSPDEPLPFLRKRLFKATLRAMSREEERQERIAEAWVKEPQPAPARAEQLTNASQLASRVWALAKSKLSPSRFAALEAIVIEEQGGPPIEETLEMSRESAGRQARRARAELVELARKQGLLDDLRWEGAENLLTIEQPLDPEEESHG
jgi:hypothetical protein